jgi:hypothetical protein
VNPDALPDNLRRRILVCDAPHPRLGSPCWVWTGRLNRNGYGRAWHNGAEPVAHRAVYEELVGPIPAGEVLDHLCRWRRCCNPGHVEPVTVRENILRGEAVLFTPSRIQPATEGVQVHA